MRKRWTGILSLIIAVALMIPAYAAETDGQPAVWKEYYVSADGSDDANGSASAPFQSVERARQAARADAPQMQGDIVIHILPGDYFLEDTLRLDDGDSGRNGYRIIYRGAEEMPMLSGGQKIEGFSLVPGRTDLWQAPVEGLERIRELYVNGEKSYMASSNRTVEGIAPYQEPGSIYSSDGMYMSKADIGIYENPQDIEMKWAMGWVTSICHVDSIIQDPANEDQVIVKMQQSWWDIQTVTGGMYGNGAKFNRHFTVENAMELLDRPGEFYYNRTEKMLYYMPRDDEDMTSAEVIAPKLEQLITVEGTSNEQKATAISFENLQFAHTTWHYPAESGILLYQQQKLNQYTDFFDYIPGAVQLNRTNDIHFEGNYFFGMASAGLDLENAVENTWVNGNAFSDIGNAAIVSGRGYHGGNDGIVNSEDNYPPETNVSDWNLINGSERLTASYYGRDQYNTLSAILGDEFWVTNNQFSYGTTWQNDPKAPEKGERTWVRYDFGKPYAIEEIVLAFDPQVVSQEQRSDFEILLSNDRTFPDAATRQVAVQNDPAENIQKYTGSAGEKYRYLMIRTLDATDFALSGAWAFTKDVPLRTVAQINKNNTISNNYINRADDTIYGGGGISGAYNEGLSILHNEVHNVSYSGIASGWGWNMENHGTKNNNISYNLIENACEYLSDGGGIYTLSDQDGSKVTNNYVKHLFTGNASFYPDEGSSNSTWDSNVQEDAFLNWHIWTDTIQNNTFTNTYGTQDSVRNNGVNNQFDPIQVFLPGQPSPEAYQVIHNAGLEPEYEYLKELVYDAPLNLPDERSRYLDIITASLIDTDILSLTKAVENMLNNGSFGSLPGQYPNEQYYKLQNAYERMSSATASEKLERMIELRDAINEAADSVYRMTFEEMLGFCENELKETPVTSNSQDLSRSQCVKLLNGVVSDTRTDTVSAKAAQEFANQLSQVKSENPETDAEQYRLLLQLEEAYRAFALSKNSTDLEYVYAPGSERTDMDREQKTVTLYFPRNTDLSSLDLTAVPFGEAVVAAKLDAVDLTKEFKIPVYSKALNSYSFWTVKTVCGESTQQSSWSTLSGEYESVSTLHDGKTLLTANQLPYMNRMAANSGQVTTVVFEPVTDNIVDPFTLIFGSNTPDLKLDGKTVRENHFEIVTDGTSGILYEVAEGAKKQLSSFAFAVKPNAANTVRIALTPQNGKTLVNVWMNDILAVNSFANIANQSGFTGFYTPDFGIKISEFKNE